MRHNGYFVTNRRFAIVVAFRNESLRSIRLADASGVATWGAFREGTLDNLKRMNDSWLRDAAAVEPGAEFPWGKIESVADNKTGAAEITLTFLGDTASETAK